MEYELGKRIKRLRKDRGWTQEQVVAKLGDTITQPTYSNWEKGIHMPTVANVKKLAEVYEVPWEYLLQDGTTIYNVESHDYSNGVVNAEIFNAVTPEWLKEIRNQHQEQMRFMQQMFEKLLAALANNDQGGH